MNTSSLLSPFAQPANAVGAEPIRPSEADFQKEGDSAGQTFADMLGGCSNITAPLKGAFSTAANEQGEMIRPEPKKKSTSGTASGNQASGTPNDEPDTKLHRTEPPLSPILQFPSAWLVVPTHFPVLPAPTLNPKSSGSSTSSTQPLAADTTAFPGTQPNPQTRMGSPIISPNSTTEFLPASEESRVPLASPEANDQQVVRQQRSSTIPFTTLPTVPDTALDADDSTVPHLPSSNLNAQTQAQSTSAKPSPNQIDLKPSWLTNVVSPDPDTLISSVQRPVRQGQTIPPNENTLAFRPAIEVDFTAGIEKPYLRPVGELIPFAQVDPSQSGTAPSATSKSTQLTDPARQQVAGTALTENPIFRLEIKSSKDSRVRPMQASATQSTTSETTATKGLERVPLAIDEATLPVLPQQLDKVPEAWTDLRGTLAAKQAYQMKTSPEPVENASVTVQKVPSREHDSSVPKEALDAFTGPATLIRPTSPVELIAATHKVRADNAVERSAKIEQLFSSIRAEVVIMRRVQPDMLSVVLRPDSGTEIVVQMTNTNGEVHAHIRCERGDFDGLNAQWGDLQRSMAAQGVKLEPLLPASRNSQSDDSKPAVSQGFGQQNPQREDRRNAMNPNFINPKPMPEKVRSIMDSTATHNVRGKNHLDTAWQKWA